MIQFAMNQNDEIVAFETAYAAIFAIGVSAVTVSAAEAAPTTVTAVAD